MGLARPKPDRPSDAPRPPVTRDHSTHGRRSTPTARRMRPHQPGPRCPGVSRRDDGPSTRRTVRRASRAGVVIDETSYIWSQDIAAQRPWRPDRVTGAFSVLTHRLKLNHVTFHSLRHFSATQFWRRRRHPDHRRKARPGESQPDVADLRPLPRCHRPGRGHRHRPRSDRPHGRPSGRSPSHCNRPSIACPQ